MLFKDIKSISLLYSGTNTGEVASGEATESILFSSMEKSLLACSLFAIKVMNLSATPMNREGSMIAQTTATLPSMEGTIFMP